MLIKYLFRQFHIVILYVTLAIAAPVVATRSGYKTASLIDSATNREIDEVLQILPVIFLLYLIHGLLLYWSKLARTQLIRGARTNLKKDMFKGILGQSLGTLSERAGGEYIADFSNNVSILEYRYYESILDSIQDVASVCVYMIAIAGLHRVFIAIILIGEFASILACLLLTRFSVEKSMVYINKLALFTQQVKEYCSALASIRHYGAEQDINREFLRINQEAEETKTVSELVINFVNTLSRLIVSMNAFAIVAVGVPLILRGEITIGIIVTAYNFTGRLGDPTRNLISKFNILQSVKGIARDMEKIAANADEESAREKNPAGAYDGIRLRNVTLTRDGRQIVSHVSMDLKPGEKYMILGKNGCGKSSLLSLLKRSFDDYEGEIALCGQELRELSYSAIGRHISYINESVALLNDTVQNNITLYRDFPPEKLEQAISAAHMKLSPDKYLTGDGRDISSGEKRRLEIARCVLSDVDTVIFDEAISTLDIRTAYEIEKAMLELPDQTAIMVSHNFSGKLISLYNKIFLMEEGRIIASGTHGELLKSCPEYRKLMDIKGLNKLPETLP